MSLLLWLQPGELLSEPGFVAELPLCCKPLESSPSTGLSLPQSKALLCLRTLDFHITKKKPKQHPKVSFGDLEASD